jgi:hypothetical protein
MRGMHFMSFLVIIIDHNQNNAEKDFIKPTTQDIDENPQMRTNGIIEHDENSRSTTQIDAAVHYITQNQAKITTAWPSRQKLAR